MPDVNIDISSDSDIDIDVTVDQYQLSDYIIMIGGFSVTLNYEQFEKLYSAIKPWFKSEEDDA